MECPVCFNRFVGPIYQCVNGHSVCFQCQPKLDKCPSCFGRYIGTRNFDLEFVFAGMTLSCSNSDFGCTENLKGDDLVKHEKECPFKPYECTLCQMWNGKKSAFRNHLQTKHPQYYFEGNTFNFCGSINNCCDGSFFVWAYEELFVVSRVVKEKTIHWIVRYLGLQANVPRFVYQLEFEVKSDSRKIKMFEKCCSDSMTYEEIISAGFCATMLISTYKTYADNENRVHMNFNIDQIEEDWIGTS